VLAAGCATAAKDVAPIDASPAAYQGYSCEQIAAETARIDARAQPLGARLDEAAQHDRAILVAALLVFAPALLALGGTKEEEAEYARLRGERAALDRSAAGQGCASF